MTFTIVLLLGLIFCYLFDVALRVKDIGDQLKRIADVLEKENRDG